jgi:shikimate 5-dehydrogenase
VNRPFPITGTFKFNRVIYIWGNPLEYSLSPFFQEHALCLSGINAVYKIFRGGKDEFSELLRADNCIGANVTTPHKTEVISICDNITEKAMRSGSVNTIFKCDGRIWGDSTDGTGLVKWITLKEKQLNEASILGNGGSAMAIAASLADIGCITTVFGRKEKGWERSFCTFCDISTWKSGVLTINTTPFDINEPAVINIGYSFENISEDAAGMLAFQGFEAALRWNGEKMIDEFKFVRIVFMHRLAQQNRYLILKLAGII